MQFMMIVKHKEGYGFPPRELMDAITKLSEEAVKAGTMRGQGGLKSTDTGAQVRLSGGQVTVTDGPFCRDQGADRGVLAVAGQVDGRGAGMGPALPGSNAGRGVRDRDSPGVRAG